MFLNKKIKVFACFFKDKITTVSIRFLIFPPPLFKSTAISELTSFFPENQTRRQFTHDKKKHTQTTPVPFRHARILIIAKMVLALCNHVLRWYYCISMFFVCLARSVVYFTMTLFIGFWKIWFKLRQLLWKSHRSLGRSGGLLIQGAIFRPIPFIYLYWDI